MTELLWIPILILLFTGPGAAALYITRVKRKDRGGLALLLAALGAAAFVLGVWMTYSFGNFFPGAGFFTCLFTPVMALVTLLVFRFEAKGVYQAIDNERSWRRWFLAGTVLLPLLQLAAPLVGFSYGQACDGLNRYAAAPIIAALEAYRADHGSYLPPGSEASASPGGVEFLAPGYLASLPRRSCKGPSLAGGDGGEADWRLYVCANSPGKEVLLLAPVIGSDSDQVYNLGTRNWSRGSAIDGYCSYLR